MPTVRYIGPFDAVDLPGLGVSVSSGDTFDCDDGAAEAFTAQTDFELVAEPAAKATKSSKSTTPEED